MQPCPPHGDNERRFWTRSSARILHVTISLLLTFLVNCEHKQSGGLPPEPPPIAAFALKDLERERTQLEG
jgi:hypothetical protein